MTSDDEHPVPTRGRQAFGVIGGILALVLLAQGAGGIINRLLHGSPGWYLANHVAFLRGYELFADLVLLALGITLATAASRCRGEDG